LRWRSVSLTRTEKKGRQLKNKLIDQIRDSIDEYATAPVIPAFTLTRGHLDDCTHFSQCWLDPSVLTLLNYGEVFLINRPRH
jgi:hypothetical protein